MLPLRGFLMLVCVYGAVSQDRGCEVTEEAIEDVLAMRERIDFLIYLLTKYSSKVEEVTKPKIVEEATTPKVVEEVTTPKIVEEVTTPRKVVTTEEVITTVKVEPTTTLATTTTAATTTTVATTTATEPLPPPSTTPEKIPMVPINFKSCKQIFNAGYKFSGVYQIHVDGFPKVMSVFCDMVTDGGGWTVIQRRLDGSIDFNRTFAEYARGFGELYGEFWLGNEIVSALTESAPSELRVDMSDWEGTDVYAKYSRFVVEGANKSYRMTLGEYEGTSGDSLSYHDRNRFSTYDVDNDVSTRNCARHHSGGWWFRNCMRSNLNGLYHPDGVFDVFPDGIEWARFRGLKYSMMFTEMKIRSVV